MLDALTVSLSNSFHFGLDLTPGFHHSGEIVDDTERRFDVWLVIAGKLVDFPREKESPAKSLIELSRQDHRRGISLGRRSPSR